VRAAGARAVTVDDAALRSAMRFGFERLKIVFEPTGALSLAAILSGAIDVRDKRVGVMISGANVSAATFAAALAEGEAG
jgi:threonine dehydratase